MSTEGCASEIPETDKGILLVMETVNCLALLIQDSKLREGITKIDVEQIIEMAEDVYTKVPLTRDING